MSNACRTAGTLCHLIYGAGRRACLRQAGQLNCNPVGIIVALVVMVGTAEIWSHSRDVGMWVVLLAGPVAIVLVTLAFVRVLQPLAVVSGARRRHRPVAEGRPVPVPQAGSGPPSPPQPAHDPGAEEIAGVPGRSDILVLRSDGAGPERPERVREPA